MKELKRVNITHIYNLKLNDAVQVRQLKYPLLHISMTTLKVAKLKRQQRKISRQLNNTIVRI